MQIVSKQLKGAYSKQSEVEVPEHLSDRPPWCNTVPVNSVTQSDNDFGYKNQTYFRKRKWAVYRVSPYVFFPFCMEDMVKRGFIEGNQVVKFMEMLESEDKEMENLAVQTLTGIQRKMYGDKVVDEVQEMLKKRK